MTPEEWEKVPGFLAAAIEQQGYGREEVAAITFSDSPDRQLKVDVLVKPLAGSTTIDVEFVSTDGRLERQ